MFARDFFAFGASGMLTRSDALSLPVQDFCTGHEQEIRYVTFLGGPSALNSSVRTTLKGWLQ